MLLEKFAPRSNARMGYEDLVARMDGAPKTGLFAAKIGFHTEMLLDALPTLLSNSDKCTDEALPLQESLKPLLFRTNDVPLEMCRWPLAATKNCCAKIYTSIFLNVVFSTLNTDGDEVWYIHEGKGTCDTILGGMKYAPGDFIFIPRHFSFGFRAEEKTVMVGIESASALRHPAGNGGDNTDTLYNNFAITLPNPNITQESEKYRNMVVKRGEKNYWTESVPSHCVAYKSTLYPFIVNTEQLNFSYTTSIHADPTNFCLFGTADDSVMISVLGPRFVHSIPYNHLNEWDEFLFYAKAYSARAGLIEAGDATLHPQGLWHGPQIPALMNWQKPEHPAWTDELAIMFESKEPLLLCEEARGILVPDYEKSWLRGWEERNKKE